MTVFRTEKEKVSNTQQPIFFGDQVNIARYDQLKYNQIEKLTRQQIGYFWTPEEVKLDRDQKDFKSLTPQEEHIFTSNLKRQILLDSIQGRALSAAFGPIVSLPEIETWFKTQEFFETIHNRSYTYLLRNVYSNPSKVFDEMMELEEIVNCAKSVSQEYDKLIRMNANSIFPSLDTGWTIFEQLDHKRQVWRTLHAVNFLEGIRFYLSFAASWMFAEQGKMEGNAKIIKFICRDENLHLAVFQHLIKLLPKEDQDFARIAIEDQEYVRNMLQEVIDQEKQWGRYLCKDGPMLGMNEEILDLFVDHISAKRANALKIEGFKQIPNPLPWISKWIGGSEVQVSPQEVNLSNYLISGVNVNVSEDAFKGFSL